MSQDQLSDLQPSDRDSDTERANAPNPTPKVEPPKDDMLRRMVERLIIENRNSLNDPTTNEPYDVKGIADDVVELIKLQQEALLNRLDAELDNIYAEDASDCKAQTSNTINKLRLEL